MKRLTKKQRLAKLHREYPGVLTIWGWDGGFKQPRHIRKRRAAQQRRRRAKAKPTRRST